MNYKLYTFLYKYCKGIFTKKVKNVIIPYSALYDLSSKKFVFPKSAINFYKIEFNNVHSKN